MSMSKADRHAKIHAEAMADFDAIQEAQREERTQAVEDRRFYSIAGAQWEGPLGEQFENKPRFEFNKVHLAIIRIFSEYRNNRITVDFTPKDGDNDEMADVCDGLYRADEKACTAEEAYDNGFEEAVGGGYGAWRLRACYEDEYDDENDKQRVVIEPITDADTCVFFDLDAKRYDKADAKRCYVLTSYTRDAYKEEWGDDPTTWEKGINQCQFDWVTADLVWVCEFYRVEEKRELVHFFRGLVDDEPDMRVTQQELDDEPGKLAELHAMGFRKVREKRVKTRSVHKYILSGGRILEDCGPIAGKCIPIVPVFGKRLVVDGIERCMGHVRLAKDAQRLTNSLLSWLADMAGRFDIEKPLLTAEQVAGHATRWAEDHIKRYPYALINGIADPATGAKIPPTTIPYTRAPQIPPAMAALIEIAYTALNDLLGNQQAGEELQPNISGKAVELIQQRLDMQVFIYMSNLAKSMKRSGEIWLSMMKDVAVEKSRRMKAVDENGAPSSVVVNDPAYDAEAMREYVKNDFSKASFDVDVEVGPSSSSKRASTVRALTAMTQMTADPEIQSILTGLAMMNMEGEGLGEARDYFRAKLVRMGVVKPSEEERQQLAQEAANQPPDPQAQYLQAAAEEAQANAKQANAKTIDTIAAAGLKQAQTQETLAKTQGAKVGQFVDLATLMRDAATPPAGLQH